MEAVSWLMDNVEGADSRREATRIMHDLVEEQLVRHASGDSSIPFLDGYFIYCIPGNKDGKLFLPPFVLPLSSLPLSSLPLLLPLPRTCSSKILACIFVLTTLFSLYFRFNRFLH